MCRAPNLTTSGRFRNFGQSHGRLPHRTACRTARSDAAAVRGRAVRRASGAFARGRPTQRKTAERCDSFVPLTRAWVGEQRIKQGRMGTAQPLQVLVSPSHGHDGSRLERALAWGDLVATAFELRSQGACVVVRPRSSERLPLPIVVIKQKSDATLTVVKLFLSAAAGRGYATMFLGIKSGVVVQRAQEEI